MTCYSKGLRKRAIKYLLGGHTPTETSKVFNVGKAALWRWKKQLEEQVDLEDKPRGKYFKKVDPQKLKEYLAARPDAYLYEIGEVFGCSSTAVSKALKRMGYTNKKIYHLQRAGGAESRGIHRKDSHNTAGSARIRRTGLAGIDRYMYRARAWSCARKNQRAQVHEGRDCGRIMLRENRVVQYDGTMESTLFEAWFKERLCPALERGKTLIMDNAAFHRKKHLERIAEASGHRVKFLPAILAGTEPDRAFLGCPKEALAERHELHEVA